MTATGSEYLILHGVAGLVGRARASVSLRRGDLVVARTGRGQELGEVLAPADQPRVRFPDPFLGDVLRQATAADRDAADRNRSRADEVCAAAEALAGSASLPVTVVDGEVLLDGRQAILHVLKRATCDEGPWLAALGERFDLIVRTYDLARDVAQDEHDHGCGSGSCGSGNCGSGNCGSGNCGSCGTGGGCSSCSSGAGEELARYFAELREQMERRRVSLV